MSKTIVPPLAGQQAPAKTPSGRSVWNAAVRYNTVLILVVLLVAASFVSPDFMTAPNMSNVARQIVSVGIMSMGMLLVVLTGGIDLSVGSVAALASVTTALLIPDYGLATAISCGLLTGVVCGAICGTLVSQYRLSSFVVTLAMMTVARGMALIVSKGAPAMIDDAGQSLLDFGRDTWWVFPQPTVLMLVIFGLGSLFLALTRAGRIVRAIGSNEEAVRLSGVPVGRHVMLAYVVSGLLAAVAGIISTARAGVGAPTIGTGDELTVIAAVVIGGASLAGGRGTVLNTLVGVVTLGVIGNIMNLASVPGYHQQVVMGIIIIVAILAQRGTGGLRGK
ncbi:ABC transporter permease [Janthinobacterium sp. J1-1]|uniref:ABC transporter permease n=1 Tax=Janthinobacterium sp. J1-1 TaxID=3065910 RepID=UPI0028125D9E|nr:ABC transporter permease [Janthinobacterium sp. J1-1]